MARVERGRNAVRRPSLVHSPILGTARVGPDRRRVDQRGYPGGDDRLKDTTAAVDVDTPGHALITAGLYQPRQVHDRAGPGKDPGQIVRGDVGANEIRAFQITPGNAPRDRDHLIDGRFTRQRPQDAGTDVASRAGDDDSHGWWNAPPHAR